MKFGGTSVADAERIRAIAEIVRARAERRPLVVVSALCGVTDLLVQAIGRALGNELEAMEPILAELERKHRWAVAAVESSGARHDLTLAVDGLFEDLRGLLRSIRVLGEGSPRAADAILSFGERLSARIVAAIFRDRGLAAREIEATEVLITDDRFGAAAPKMEQVGERCRLRLEPLVARDEIPVIAGFVGATPNGETTTLGRGGSDTSAAIFGAAMGAEEIQIWTDVDGLMSADPRKVPTARTLEHVSFEEAAELAFYGARVLHPASVVSAVRRGIPVRVLNSLGPEGPGTLILENPGPSGAAPLALASREGVQVVRWTAALDRRAPGLATRVLNAARSLELHPDLLVASEGAITLVLPETLELSALESRLSGEATLTATPARAILSVVGSGLADGATRRQVLAALAEWDPDLVAVGSSQISVTAVVAGKNLEPALRSLHRSFLERSPV